MPKNTVLVVEPDLDIRQVVCDRLEHAGYQVVEAATGEAALDLCQRTDLCGVLLEGQLAGARGLGGVG